MSPTSPPAIRPGRGGRLATRCCFQRISECALRAQLYLGTIEERTRWLDETEFSYPTGEY